MKWQKARQIAVYDYDSEQERRCLGKTFWVKGPPIDYYKDGIPVFITNIYPMTITAENTELLAEFADDVDEIPWDEFVK